MTHHPHLPHLHVVTMVGGDRQDPRSAPAEPIDLETLRTDGNTRTWRVSWRGGSRSVQVRTCHCDTLCLRVMSPVITEKEYLLVCKLTDGEVGVLAVVLCVRCLVAAVDGWVVVTVVCRV